MLMNPNHTSNPNHQQTTKSKPLNLASFAHRARVYKQMSSMKDLYSIKRENTAIYYNDWKQQSTLNKF